jgi:hypothetical protein
MRNWLVLMLVISALWGVMPHGCGSTTTPHYVPQKKILFVGNSITVHDPAPSIGWYGNWGMAASAADKDFVHLTAARYGADFRTANAGDWETGYQSFDYSTMRPLDGWADTVVIKVGENVRNYDTDFAEAFRKLVQSVSTSTSRVYIVSTWWMGDLYQAINRDMQKVAREFGYRWVQIPEHDASFNALGFSDSAVASHPGDKGMQLIADSICAVISGN